MWRFMVLAFVVLVAVVEPRPEEVVAAGTVGSGSPASCTEAALNSALAGGGLVTFNCGPGPLTITLTGTKFINSAVTLNGGGLIKLSGGGSVQLLNVSSSGNLTLQNIAVGEGAAGQGGGIQNSGVLAVQNVTFTGNSATAGLGRGGAIANSFQASLTVTQSTFVGNHANQGSGGAIDNFFGSVTVTDSVFEDNQASLGGAVASYGTLDISGSTFERNSAFDGGAIANGPASGVPTIEVSVIDSRFSGNKAESRGGAIANFGDFAVASVNVTRTTLEENEAGSLGAGIYSSLGVVTVTESTFARNKGLPASTGGIFNHGGTLSVISSTFWQNYSGGGPGAISSFRNVNIPGNTAHLDVTNSTFVENDGNDTGALVSDSAFITNSTFVGNRSRTVIPDSATWRTNAGGSGIWASNNIVVNNSWLYGPGQGCATAGGSNNIEWPGSSCGPSGFASVDPALGMFGEHGGPTRTVSLLAGSPAINAGLVSTCTAATPNGPGGVDQRGFAHVGACDIGSFEYGQNPAPATHLVFSSQPQGTTVGAAFPTQPSVQIRDGGNALASWDSTTLITLSVSGGTGDLSCTGGFIRQVVNGVADFAGCTVTGSGAYSLHASSSPGLAPADSSPFLMSAQNAETGLLRLTTSPALPSQVSINGIPMDDWTLNWVKLPPGRYTVSFSDLLGFTTPQPQTVAVVEGRVTDVQGNFVARGNLRVVTSPPVPSTVRIDGVPRNDWGLWTDLPIGKHAVCFGAVAGFFTPSCQTVDLSAGVTTVVTGEFVNYASEPGPADDFGLLRAQTVPAVPSQILIDGVPRTDWGLDWVKLAPGTYTVSFGDVRDYSGPAPQVVTVSSGQVTTVTGNFVHRGWLAVFTSPPVPATIYVDGLPREDWGLWTSMESGSYRVCFGPVPHFNVPDCQDVNVSSGQTTLVTGTFFPAPFNPAAVGVVSAEMVSGDTARVLISYAIDGENDGHWGAAVFYIHTCTDSNSDPVADGGVGGLTQWGEVPLVGRSGIVAYVHHANIAAVDPTAAYPVTCEKVSLDVAHRPTGGAADFSTTTIPLLAHTVWQH